MIFDSVLKFLQTPRRCRPFPDAFCVSTVFTAVVAAKLVHIYFHLGTLRFPFVYIWGPTIIFQDVLLVLASRILSYEHESRARIWMNLLSALLSLDMLFMASARIAFRFVTGTELHWKSAFSFPRDNAGFHTLLSGSAAFIGTAAAVLVLAWFVRAPVHAATGFLVDSIHACATSFISFVRNPFASRRFSDQPIDLESLKDQSYRDGNEEEDAGSTSALLSGTASQKRHVEFVPMRNLLSTFIFFVLAFLFCFQPPYPSYTHLSSSLPIIPLSVILRTNTAHELNRMVHISTSLLEEQDHHIAFSLFDLFHGRPSHPPPHHPSLNHPPPSQDDGREHSEPILDDPLHISNMADEILSPLKEAFDQSNVNIKHIILLKLESTRDDMFPLRNDSYVWQRISEAYDGVVPVDVEQRLANLTPTAEYLTGRATGLGQDEKTVKPRGGVVANNDVTTSTYTLKSVTGSVCGVEPLTADFNIEYKQQIYQECLPHILDGFNSQLHDAEEDDFRSWEWKSVWMQSVTDGYDHQADLTPVLGYKNIVTKETMEDPKATFYPPKSEEVNYYGYPDTELRPYLRQMLEDAEKNHERLFLTHLTGTTHHPWGMPHGEYEEFMNDVEGKQPREINQYINTIGFDDAWVGEILEMLEDVGIADETLVVAVGDHGISLPFDGSPTPYHNAHISNLRVPLVFSHPRIPPVTIDAPVISSQILPTILDLLVSSSSLSSTSAETAKGLQTRYEGQSLIRPLHATTKDGHPDWQFTVLNPGGSSLALRDSVHNYRLVIPLTAGVEWEFSDLGQDPHELDRLKRLDPVDLVGSVLEHQGADAVAWIREATQVSQWWISRNWKRWGYADAWNNWMPPPPPKHGHEHGP